jgi:hypothetical protein
MTHQKYSVKFLLNKGISYCKMVANALGVTPEGDKRQVITWADAIVSHQANSQFVETQKQQVVIEYIKGLTTCDLAAYVVKDLDGKIVRDDFRTLAAAERWAAKQFEIVEQQSIAQQELVEQIETQIQDRTEQIVIREIDFAYSKVVRITPNGVEVLATIIYDLDTENWEVQLKGRFESFLTYAEAEAFALNYIDDERGSGRILPISQVENYDIEDQRITDLLGERYTVRFKGHLAGNIWLDIDKGWTLGSDYYSEPLMAAKTLAKLTRKELV